MNSDVCNKDIIAEGWIYGYSLIVPNCPICGLVHKHGNHGYNKGDTTSRMSHCTENRRNMHINVQGDLTEQEYEKIIKCCDSRKKYKKKVSFESEEKMTNMMCENCEKIFSRDNRLIPGDEYSCPFCGKKGTYVPDVRFFTIRGILKAKD